MFEAGELAIKADDHGVTVGDGCFETLKVTGGVPFAMTRHLVRLRRSCSGLGLPMPAEDRIRTAVAEVLADESAAGRLRITVTGGPGPLGSGRGDAEPTLIVSVGPAPEWSGAARLVTVPWRRNERSAVAGLKTTSYAENVVALEYAHALGADEALFYDTQDRLSEGTGSNVFLVHGERVRTPALDNGCLAEITRGLLLEWTDAEEATLSQLDLESADEVFITSSTRDLQLVDRVDDARFPGDGPVTSRLLRQFNDFAAAEIDP
jgi:branched-chain amino acid aminotransferase